MPPRLLPALTLLCLAVALPVLFRLAGIVLRDSSSPSLLLEKSGQQVVVSATGMVANPGIYALPAGATLKGLLALAQPRPGLMILSDGDNTQLITGHEYHFSSQAGRGLVVRPLGIRARAVLGLLLDINLASADELDALPYMSREVASRIVEYRERYGPFSETDDLLKVKGVGPRLFK